MIFAAAGSSSPWPRVSYNADADEYLVVWQDDRNGDWDIYSQRISAGGALLGENFALTTAPGDQTRARLDWDSGSGRYLVVWNGDGVEGRWVQADGTPDGEALTLAPDGSGRDMAYGSESGLFVVDLGGGHVRYHHLFRDFLCHRLTVQAARAAHLKASECWLGQGEEEEAIHHLLAADSFEKAASILDRLGKDMVRAGRLDTLAGWVGSLPPQVAAFLPDDFF